MTPQSAPDATLPSPAKAVLTDCPWLGGHSWLPLEGGRSNHSWQVGAWVVKLYDPESASPLFPNSLACEARALRHLAGAGLAPTLRHQGSGWLIYEHVPGARWQSGTAAVARLLGRLHARPTDPGFRAAPTGSSALADHARSFAPLTDLPPLPPDAGVPPASKPRLIHGDAVPGNIIACDENLTLIDWQCPALGDPAEDLAAFLSPAMQHLYRGHALTEGEAAAFLAAYPDAEIVARYRRLAPILHWRIAAHCAWRAQRGDGDYAQALRLEIAAL